MKSSDDGLEKFARSLGAFGPRTVSVDREALLFAAGQASVKPAKDYHRPMRGLRYWQASTVAMSLVSVSLGASLAWQSPPAPRIVYVERQIPAVASNTTSDAVFQPSIQSPDAVVSRPVEASPREADDAQLAEAWQARQDQIAVSGQPDRQLAASIRFEGHSQQEQQLTRSSLLGDRSQETIQRWMKEQL